MPLAPEVKHAAIGALRALHPVWVSLPKNDYRRLLRPRGDGSYSIDIEAYHGSFTAIGFFKHLDTSPEVSELSKAIAHHQPELAGHLVLPNQAMQLGDSKELVATWCRALESTEADEDAVDVQIALLIEKFSALLDERRLTHRITTSIAGLKLPAKDFTLSLDHGVTLRSMTDDELVELSSQDITFGREHDIMGYAVSSCLEFEGFVPFSLELSRQQVLLTPTLEQKARDYTTDVLRALHVLRSGRAGIFMSTGTYTPKLLPNLWQGSTWPLQGAQFASFDLLAEDIDVLLKLLRSIRAGVRDEIRIAADRLFDAENRLSPVDALLDAAIGLEALLNPMDASELAFRVALNYAHLATAEHRRERYERVRSLQKTRNRVVHGGLNLQSADASTIHEHAGLAKACLRDAVQSFLLDPSLSGNRRLDADFWLDRILPANVIGAQALPTEK